MTDTDLSLVAARRLRVTLVATVLLGAAGFVSGVLANRLLGPSGRGTLAAVQTAPGLLATVGAVGMVEAVVYLTSRRPQRSRSLLAGGLMVAASGSVLAVVAGWFLLALLLRAQSDETLHVARLYLLGVPILVTSLVGPSVLRSGGDFAAWNVWRCVPGMLWTAVVVVATATGHDEVPLLVYSHLGLLLLASAPMLAMSFRRAAGPAAPEREDLRSLLTYGLPTAGQTIPQLLNLRLDQFLISATLPSTQLGLYAAAVNWCIGITLLMDACGFVLLPSLASIDDRAEQLRRFAQSSRLGLALALALAAATAAVTPLLFTALFGASFADGVPAALVLAAANGALGYSRVLADGVRGLGEPVIALIGEIGGLVVMAVALGALLPPLGIEGAALGSLIGYSAIAAGILLQVKRRFGLPLSDLLSVRPAEVIRAVTSLHPPRLRP